MLWILRSVLTLFSETDFDLLFQALRSFQLTVEVDPVHHPKIIGRKGAVISKIRTDHDVNIQFPDKSSPSQNIITITGFEKNTESARDEILKIVQELVILSLWFNLSL